MCFVSLKYWCWSLRSVFMHLYRESTMHIHERTRCFYFLLRGRFTGTSYWRWKGSQLHPLRFKNTMLLTPWCQKLEHYHFKHNLQFKAKEIKIRVVLFLVLKHMNCREAWNSPTSSCFIFCMTLYNGICCTEWISQYVCYFPWVPFPLFYLGCISLVSRDQSKAAGGCNTWLWECQLL